MRVARLDAAALRAPLERPVATSFGVMRDRPAVLVRLEASDGAWGWGEVFANWPAAGAEHRVRLAVRDVAPLVLGRDDAPEGAAARLDAATRTVALQSGEWGPFRQVAAGIDAALHDLAARRAGMPLRAWLRGDAPDRVPAYASGIHVRDAAAAIPAARAAGFRRFKLKVGFDAEGDVVGLREAAADLRPGEALACDANQAWDAARARAFLEATGDLPLAWVEEPIAADAPAADWTALTGAHPLAGGENLAGEAAFAAASWLSVIQPDVAKWGGASGCLAVARAALAGGRRYCPHFLGAAPGLLASAALLAGAGGDGWLEVDVNPNPLREAWPLDVAEGDVRLPAGPGLGHDDPLAGLRDLIMLEERARA